MKIAYSTSAAVLVALALTACETNRVAGTAPAMTTAAAPGAYDQGMQRLQQGAQRLRDAVQLMAQQPAGPRRNQAIAEAHAALINANEAMSQLYQPGRGTGTTLATGRGAVVGGTVYPQSDADYTRAMERLLQAAQKFRESIQAMSQMPPGPQRDQAIAQAHQALFDTNQAMIQLPPELRTK